MTEPTAIDILLTNLKHHPWHLYPDFKIDEKTGKALLKLFGVKEEEPAVHHYIYGVKENGEPELVEVKDEQ